MGAHSGGQEIKRQKSGGQGSLGSEMEGVPYPLCFLPNRNHLCMNI